MPEIHLKSLDLLIVPVGYLLKTRKNSNIKKYIFT